jgi:hypothetical protein
MLIFSRIFPQKEEGQSLYWYIKTTVGDLHRVLKYSWQRYRRGWADCDTWSVDYWFRAVVPEMLRHLANNHHGIPIDFVRDGEEIDDGSWKKTLLQIADDLEAIKRFEAKWYDSGLYSHDRLDECLKEEAEAHNKVLAGVEAFKEYFYNLWD